MSSIDSQLDVYSFKGNYHLLENDTIHTWNGTGWLVNNSMTPFFFDSNIAPSLFSLNGNNLSLLVASHSGYGTCYGYDLENVYPTNPYLEVGDVDGTREWNYSGGFNITERTQDFSVAITSYLSTCELEDGVCNVPLYFYSGAAGKLEISNIYVTYTLDPNPVQISISTVQSYLNSSTTDNIDIPIKFENSANGTITISDIRFDYAGGNYTYPLIVYDPTNNHNVSTFNNSLSEENITFSGNENHTRYLSLGRYANITSAILNITWNESAGSYPTNPCLEVGTPDGICEWEKNGTLPQLGTFNQSAHFVVVTGGSFENKHYMNDSDFVTYSNSTDNPSYKFDNLSFSVPGNSTVDNIVWNLKLDHVNATGGLDCSSLFGSSAWYFYWDWVSSNWVNPTVHNNPVSFCGYNRTIYATLSLNAINEDGLVMFKINESFFCAYPSKTGHSRIKEIWVEYTVRDFETNDLSSSINTALNEGLCDCTGCVLVDETCNVPFQFHSDSVGILGYILSPVKFKEILRLINFFSDWDFNFPRFVDFFEFIPSTSTSKNVTPYGQTPTTPIFNFTTMNYGGRNMNLSVYLNESHSCVNLTYSTDQYKSNGTLLTNQTWMDIFTNLEYLNNSQLWLFADYNNCSDVHWSLWYPEIYIRGCCDSCVCSKDLI